MFKNILFVSPTGALTNGAEVAGYHLMKYLVENGCVVTNAYSEAYRRVSITEADSYDARMRDAGIFIEKVDFGWWVPSDESNFVAEAVATQQLVSIVERRNIDLVITNTSNMPWGALAAGMTNVRHVWLLHEFPTENFSWLANKYNFIADFSDRIYCASKTLSRRIRNEVVQSGRDAEVAHFYPFTEVKHVKVRDADDMAARLVCIGNVDPRKNQAELIRALGVLHREHKALPLILIGACHDTDYLAELRELIVELQVGEFVEFAGFNSDPWSLISNSDIVVQSSTSEVFSLVICEGAKLGLPMILSNNPAATEISNLLDVGHTYDLGNVAELVATIEGILNNIEAERTRAQNAAPIAQELLSISNCSQSIFEYILDHEQTTESSLAHLKKYFSNYVNDRERKLSDLERAVVEQQVLLDDRLQLLESQNVEITAIYESKTWQIGHLMVRPFSCLVNLARRMRSKAGR